MAVIDLELPLLLVAAAVTCALLVWLLGTFTMFLRTRRYRISAGAIFFSLSGLMGFFSALKIEATFFGDWFAAHPGPLFVAIAYCGYGLFGFFGCWTAVRVAGRFDRKHTLAELYSALETRKNTGAG